MIIRPFNSVFNISASLMLALLLGAYFAFRNKSEKTKKSFIVTIAVIDMLCFVVYKIALSRDAQFLALKEIEKFNWLDELPLQLCNINMFLIPIGVLTGSRALMGFSYITAPLGALLAIVLPDPSFVGFSIFLPRILGYYITHMLVFCCGVWLALLGFYKPKISDMPRVFIALILVSFGAHCVNLIFRATGLCTFANYFYTFGADISLLNLFWSWIPIPYLFELPAMVILLIYMAFQIGLFALIDKVRKKKAVTV